MTTSPAARSTLDQLTASVVARARLERARAADAIVRDDTTRVAFHAHCTVSLPVLLEALGEGDEAVRIGQVVTENVIDILDAGLTVSRLVESHGLTPQGPDAP